jgi:hypothetical protein
MSWPEEPSLRRLKVDLSEVAFALENASCEMRHFLDLETGDVAYIGDEIRTELDEIDEELGDDDSASFETALASRGLPEWMGQAVREAVEIDRGFGTRFVEVPHAESRAGYADMEDFIETVTDERLRNALWRAIAGRRAFGRFKDVLFDHTAERDRWHRFKDDRGRERAIEWLRSEGIEPIEEGT